MGFLIFVLLIGAFIAVVVLIARSSSSTASSSPPPLPPHARAVAESPRSAQGKGVGGAAAPRSGEAQPHGAVANKHRGGVAQPLPTPAAAPKRPSSTTGVGTASARGEGRVPTPTSVVAATTPPPQRTTPSRTLVTPAPIRAPASTAQEVVQPNARPPLSVRVALAAAAPVAVRPPAAERVVLQTSVQIADAGGMYPRVPTPAPRSDSRGLAWVGHGSVVLPTPDKLSLRDPLTYFTQRGSAGDGEPSAIDLSASVSPPGQKDFDHDFGYWPSYTRLTSPQRRTYVEWLAGGRSTVPPSVGYVFLFIYGLERRALAENATDDISLIFDEVVRLRSLYTTAGTAMNRSLDGYTASFLWFLAMKFPEQVGDDRFRTWCHGYALDHEYGWSEDHVAALTSWFAMREQALPEWAAFSLAAQLPKSVQSVVARRVAGQLRDLFSRRFVTQFPSGVELRVSKRSKRFPYRPASAALPAFTIDQPNPMGVSSQFDVLADLWNTCVDDLRKLSSIVKDDVAAELTADAWEATPPELRDGIDHPLTAPFMAFVQQHTVPDGHVRCTAAELCSLCGIASVKERITPGQSRRAAELSEYAGFCIEPDARLTGRGYEPEQLLAMFPEIEHGDFNAKRYNAAACLLAAGLAIAHADGRAEANEVAVLSQQLRSLFELTTAEQRRLDASKALLLAEGIDLASAAKRLKQLDGNQLELAAKLILAIVVADGVVTKEELKAVRKLYGSMGFTRDHINETLAALKVDRNAVAGEQDEPVTVAAAVPGVTGEAIPQAPDAEAVQGVRLDREAIAAIMRDTHEVARLLADAMAQHDDVGPQVVTASPGAPASTGAAATTTSGASPSEPGKASEEIMNPVKPAGPTAGPTSISPPPDVTVGADIPLRYAAFYQLLLTKPTWTRQELVDIAKRSSLMLSGAVDAINDWSNEKHGGPLVYEDGDAYTLETAYLN